MSRKMRKRMKKLIRVSFNGKPYKWWEVSAAFYKNLLEFQKNHPRFDMVIETDFKVERFYK